MALNNLDHNTRAGRRLGTYYKKQRVLGGDPYWGSEVNAEGGLPVLRWSGALTLQFDFYVLGNPATMDLDEVQAQLPLIQRKGGLYVGGTQLPLISVDLTVEFVEAIPDGVDSVEVSVPTRGWNLSADQIVVEPELVPWGKWRVSITKERNPVPQFDGREVHRILLEPLNEAARMGVAARESVPPTVIQPAFVQCVAPAGKYWVGVRDRPETRIEVPAIVDSVWTSGVAEFPYGQFEDLFDFGRIFMLAGEVLDVVNADTGAALAGLGDPVAVGPADIHFTASSATGEDVREGDGPGNTECAFNLWIRPLAAGSR